MLLHLYIGKSIYNLWKFHGLIDEFNESRRKIDSGAEKWHMSQ